ncbi:MAG TPA: histidine phosphatase family protein [Firmicutes bacterium]|nr:histidine phosphatase family protein [Bacillota bacterium]
MELYLVRHGETESNREKRYTGWTESPLSSSGLRQAEKAGVFLAAAGIDELYCSDLQRAVATASLIGAGSGLEPLVTPLLREIHFGEWEGLTYREIEKKWGNAVREWFDDPFGRSAPGGETIEDVCRRLRTFIAHLEKSRKDGKKIALVSHGGTIRAFLYNLLALDRKSFWDMRIDNASISLLRREDGCYKIVYRNRLDHLAAADERKESNDAD